MAKIVLCVDDSATMQQVADITFRGTDYQYVGARSYDEGLQKAKGQKPALVLADAQLGNKSGYDLCLALKQDSATADVPVVILIGNHAPFDAAKGTQCGADANLPKPWDTQTMIEKVNEIVGKASNGVAKPGQAAAPVAAAPAAAAKPAAAASTNTSPAAAAAAAAAAASAMPPRSATIMGMPTIKLPGGVVAPAPAPAGKTPAAAVPTPMAPAAQMTTPGPGPAGASTRTPAPAAQPAAQPAAHKDAPKDPPAPSLAIAPSTSFGIGGMNRPPMLAGNPTKRSALVERTLAKMAGRLAEATGLEPGSPELLALLRLSAEVVERVVWEVVPDLAEQIIRENLKELAANHRS